MNCFLKVGDVFRNGGLEYVVEMVNESRARAQCLHREQRTVENKLHDTQHTFLSQAKVISVSPRCEQKDILRNDKSLVRTKAGQVSKQTNNTKGQTDMAKKEVIESKGKLGGLMGFSATAVLRALGKAGVKVAHARAIMKKQGVKASDTTCSIQINWGKNGKGGEPAGITKAQIKELRDCVPDPDVVAAEEKKAQEAKDAAKEKADKEAKAAAKEAKAEAAAAK